MVAPKRRATTNKFAPRLRRAREIKFSSQKAFAEACGFQAETYRMWERGDREPNLNNLRIIAETLSVSLDDLIIGDAGERSPPQRWNWQTDTEHQVSSISLVTRHTANYGVNPSIPWHIVTEMMHKREPIVDLTFQYLINGRMTVISVSGEPLYAENGIFKGYSGNGREVVGDELEQYLRNNKDDY